MPTGVAMIDQIAREDQAGGGGGARRRCHRISEAGVGDAADHESAVVLWLISAEDLHRVAVDVAVVVELYIFLSIVTAAGMEHDLADDDISGQELARFEHLQVLVGEGDSGGGLFEFISGAPRALLRLPTMHRGPSML